MRIGETPQIRASEKVKKKSTSASGGEFSDYLTGDAEETSDVCASNAAQSLNSFLFLQEVSDEEVGRRRALKQGQDTLVALEQLHRDMLMGLVPVCTLKRIETVIAEQRRAFVPPKLANLLDEIELRALVELAKLGM